VVKEGDVVKVKLLGFDDRGKVRLSMKVVDQATGEDLSAQMGEEAEDRGPRHDRGDRGPRRHGGGRDRDRGERRERKESAGGE
jgi:polyribonucleotide nucleotidyltransferase